uniref:uncharacterized protein n=1 Tax=Semicossyphus pulcher TaxID=241346 RepID=UPI0037E74BF2
MSFFSHFLLNFCVLGNIFCGSEAWYVDMPGYAEGLLGSCLVIPCSFNYNSYPPRRPNRVVWYNYVNRGYPLVYDGWSPGKVIHAFIGDTKLLSGYRKCTLEINPVRNLHHGHRIYPWVDPENIGKSTHKFYEKTVKISVVDRSNTPRIMIYGEKKVGQPVTVECTIDHTCPSYPPTLSLNIPLKSQYLTHGSYTDGTFYTTLTTTLNIQTDHQTVVCSVRHTGGISASASRALSAECSFSPLTIQPTSIELLEGQERAITCTAIYTCSKHIPTLTWNYGSMPASTDTTKSGSAQWRTVSTLKFTAAANDHGKYLTCYARFSGGQRQEVKLYLRVKRNMLLRGWTFTTPGSITGMRGSCIILPCSFSYTSTQPADLQVIWYLFQTNAYQPVFDQRQTVISKFNGRTSLTGSVSDRNCSLKIERLEMSHNNDRLYPWVDKNPITSFSSQGFSFQDKTSQIIVLDKAEKPQLNIIGIPRVGEESKVSCIVHHTCISAAPTLTLSGIPGQDSITDTVVSDGKWERKMERTWPVKEEDQSVTCSVRYHGGQEATSELKLNVECPYEDIKMTEPPGDVTEGVARSVICSVSYKCQKNKPTFMWNYEDMQSSLVTTKMSSDTYNTMSNLTFIAALKDDNSSLTCTAQFVTGETKASATLRVKKYEKPYGEMYPSSFGTPHVLAADVPFRFNALTSSCVVIPCTFRHPEDVPLTRGIWAKKIGGVVYHNARSYVLDHFKGRTKIIGELHGGQCSLEIDDIKPFDNGPFCFYAERGDDKYRFNNSCVFIVMKASPEKPDIVHPAEVDAGSTITASCSVKHTCPTHPPGFSWSVPIITSHVTHMGTQHDIWETTSTVTYMVAAGDGLKNVTCTAISWGDKRRASVVEMTVKGTVSYQFRSSLPIVIPVLILVITAAVLGVFIYRRRESLREIISRRLAKGREKPPRPERPERPEKRKSIWSRFSRRHDDGRIGWQNERNPRRSFWNRFSRRQDDTANLRVVYSKSPATENNYVSKPRCPSPKSNRRPAPPSP